MTSFIESVVEQVALAQRLRESLLPLVSSDRRLTAVAKFVGRAL